MNTRLLYILNVIYRNPGARVSDLLTEDDFKYIEDLVKKLND